MAMFSIELFSRYTYFQTYKCYPSVFLFCLFVLNYPHSERLFLLVLCYFLIWSLQPLHLNPSQITSGKKLMITSLLFGCLSEFSETAILSRWMTKNPNKGFHQMTRIFRARFPNQLVSLIYYLLIFYNEWFY